MKGKGGKESGKDGGGHSQEIVNRMNNRGRLMVIDKDKSAIADAKSRFKDDDRVVVVLY